MYNSNGYGRSSNSIGGRDDNNNQASIRNPPGAFHNSGSTLAQQNLLVYIIKEIKIQSIGIWQRLLIIFDKKNFNSPFCCSKTKTTTIDDGQPSNSKDITGYDKMHKIVTKEDYKDKDGREQQKLKMSMKIKRMIELWELIGNSHWQNLLLVTMSQIFKQKLTSSSSSSLSLTRVSNIPTTIDATTILNILEEAKPTAECIVISYCTEAVAAATCIIDNPFNGHPNEQLYVKYNDNDNDNNNNNNYYYNNYNIIKLYKCKRNNCNNGNNRQPNYNAHSSMEYNYCGSSISRQKFIVTSNKNHENVHFFAYISSLAPLATCLLYFLFLLLLLFLWYSNIGPSSSSSVAEAVAVAKAELNDHIICCILSGIQVKQQQQQQRQYLKTFHDNNLCYHTTRRLSSNSRHYFNNNSIEQQQQQQQLEICITTTNMISANLLVLR